MGTVLSLPVVAGLLVILGGLAVVAWLGLWSVDGPRPAPIRLDEPGGGAARPDAAAVLAVALERAEGMCRLGRHDERRCTY